MWEKRSIVHEELIFLRSLDVLYEAWKCSRSINILILRSMKRREGVFLPKAQKRYVYKSFMHRKEVNCKIVYILDSKLYTSNITDLVQQMLH
jgi:predicted transcriptional regulator